MSYVDTINTLPDPSTASAFGTPETAELHPVLQGDFVYGLNTQLWSTPTVSGAGATVDTNASRLRIQSGIGAAGYAYITSNKIIRYRAGQGTTARFTPLFTTGAANSTQLWGVGSIVSNAPYDGYFFGYNGASFGVAHYISGTPTWTAQSAWNVDKVDGSAGSSFTWDVTKGSPVMIKYPYLGYGNIEYFVQNPTTSRWALVHIDRYANTTIATELSNPNLQFVGFTKNSGNTSNLTMYCGSVGVFVSGMRLFVSNPRWATDNNKTGIGSTETCLVNLRNCTTYNGVTNRGMIRLNSLSFGSGNNSVATLRLRIGATIGGSPSYAPISGTTADNGVTLTAANSIASVDTAGTTSVGGTYIYNVTIGNTGSNVIDLEPFEIFLTPGQILTCAASATASSTLGVSLNWSEDI